MYERHNCAYCGMPFRLNEERRTWKGRLFHSHRPCKEMYIKQHEELRQFAQGRRESRREDQDEMA